MKKWLTAGLLMGSIFTVSAQETPRTAAPDPAGIQLVAVAEGIDRPLFVTHANDGSGRLFIVSQGGIIYVTDNGADSTFLDLTDSLTFDVNAGGYTERGVLGLAFSPQYATDGTFYVNYTDGSGGTVIARYQVSAEDANVADASSQEIILTIDQPFPNHNGGAMAFGRDGYLYIGTGDGGAANDPLGNGQKLDTLLGKILRLDVSGDGAYTIPSDNPFVGVDGARAEIWAYGLRNPWRFSFDRTTGDLYMGDVGQNKWEEINFQPTSSLGGDNYGWAAFEATHVFNQNISADTPLMPILEYAHGDAGCSVTGGYVYRGAAVPDLEGVYVYGDFCSGNIWGAYRDASDTWQNTLLFATGEPVSSFGEDESGELYVTIYSGTVYQFTQK